MLSRKFIRNISAANLGNIFKKNLSGRISSDYVITASLPELDIPNVTLPEFLDPYHQKFEKFTAIECAQTKRKYTYGEVRTKSANLAKAFRKVLKLEEGDVVAIALLNQPEYPIANLGILKGNLITTTINPVYTAEEIMRQFKNSDTKAVITEVQFVPQIRKALQLLHKDIPILAIKTETTQSLPDKTINFGELVDVNFDYPNIKPCDCRNVAFLPYSSGTTGLPKGVELTHRNLVANVLQTNNPEVQLSQDATDNHQDELPVVLPLFHILGYSIILNGLSTSGVKFHTLPKFHPEWFIRLLKDEKISLLYLVPPLVIMMNGLDVIKPEYAKYVRYLLCSAAPLAASDENRLHEKFGRHIGVLQGYGLTETSPAITGSYPKMIHSEKAVRGTIGLPTQNTEIKVVALDDPKTKGLPANTKGELLVRGPQVMKGYHNLPEETKKCFTEDGWFRTGDVSYYDEDGRLFIADRIKELIKVKGLQVAPAEVEEVIRSYPGVLDAGVIGIPHDTHGEVPRAYVIPKGGTQLNVDELYSFMNQKLAKYKLPVGGIALVEDIPKNPSGKILRRELRDKFLQNGL